MYKLTTSAIYLSPTNTPWFKTRKPILSPTAGRVGDTASSMTPSPPLGVRVRKQYVGKVALEPNGLTTSNRPASRKHALVVRRQPHTHLFHVRVHPVSSPLLFSTQGATENRVTRVCRPAGRSAVCRRVGPNGGGGNRQFCRAPPFISSSPLRTTHTHLHPLR